MQQIKQNRGTKSSQFSRFIDGKLSTFDKHKRQLAEKRINNVLFEMEVKLEITPPVKGKPLTIKQF